MSDLVLQNRSYQLTVQPDDKTFTGSIIDCSNLDIKFRVRKSIRQPPKPNTADITIYGLSEETRAYFGLTKTLNVTLLAGYGGQNEQIFKGQVMTAWTHVDGPEIETKLETGDSEKEMALAGVRISFAEQTTLESAIKAIGSQIPTVSMSSLDQAIARSVFGAAQVFHPKGGAVSKSAARFLDDICRSAALEWSLQDGALLIMPKGAALQGQVPLLNPDTGLIGSPANDKKGDMTIRSLIIPGLRCAAKIKVESENCNGFYRIQQIEYHGDTSPGAVQWYATMHCQKV